MKDLKNHRITLSFSPRTKNLIMMMSEKYGVSRNRIMTEAIDMYAEKKAEETGSLMSFASSLDITQGTEILDVIKKERMDKEQEVSQ